MAYGVSHYQFDHDLPAIRLAYVPESMGNMAFLFLSHNICLPVSQSLEDDLKRPRRFHSVVYVSFLIILIVNDVFGMLYPFLGENRFYNSSPPTPLPAALCYGYFADSTEDNIINNLGKGPILQAVRVLNGGVLRLKVVLRRLARWC